MARERAYVLVDVRTYQGSRDGIRFGEVTFFPGGPRHFLLDRLSRRVRLWRAVKGGLNHPDLSKARQAAALKVFQSREPFP